MIGYWTRFAKTGDPNEKGSVEWPVYTEKEDKHLLIDSEIKEDKNLRKKYCDFFDAVRELQEPKEKEPADKDTDSGQANPPDEEKQPEK